MKRYEAIRNEVIDEWDVWIMIEGEPHAPICYDVKEGDAKRIADALNAMECLTPHTQLEQLAASLDTLLTQASTIEKDQICKKRLDAIEDKMVQVIDILSCLRYTNRRLDAIERYRDKHPTATHLEDRLDRQARTLGRLVERLDALEKPTKH